LLHKKKETTTKAAAAAINQKLQEVNHSASLDIDFRVISSRHQEEEE